MQFNKGNKYELEKRDRPDWNQPTKPYTTTKSKQDGKKK